MIMSIAWLYDQELYQCLSPGCLTTNLVFLAVRLLIIWLPDSFQSENFVILSRLEAERPVISWSSVSLVVWPWPMIMLSSVPWLWEQNYHLITCLLWQGRPVIILITCLSFRLSIGNFTIVSWLCGQWSFDHKYLDCMTRGDFFSHMTYV